MDTAVRASVSADSRVRGRAYDQFPDEHAVGQVLREVRLAQHQLLDDGRRQRQHGDAQVAAAGRGERRTLSCKPRQRAVGTCARGSVLSLGYSDEGRTYLGIQ